MGQNQQSFQNEIRLDCSSGYQHSCLDAELIGDTILIDVFRDYENAGVYLSLESTKVLRDFLSDQIVNMEKQRLD